MLHKSVTTRFLSTLNMYNSSSVYSRVVRREEFRVQLPPASRSASLLLLHSPYTPPAEHLKVKHDIAYIKIKIKLI